MDPRSAAADSARRKIKRANGLLRDAARDLAQLADDDAAPLGVLRAHDSESIAAAHDLISVGVAKHGAVDVIVIARSRRDHHSPTGAEENTHGTTQHAALPEAEGAP